MADILLIDDDLDQLRLRGLVLQRRGHSVRSARTAGEAISLTTERVPDCAVMDLRLPTARDGRNLLDELKRRWPALPVVMLTGFPQDVEGTAEESLIAELLRKPVRSERLLSAISRVAMAMLLFLPAAAAQDRPFEAKFEVTAADAEQVAQLDMLALGADWAKPGREGALAAISVDGGAPHHVWVFGENVRPANVFLGRLSAGMHTIRISRDRRSAPSAGLRVRNVRVTQVPASSRQSAIFMHAPVLFARTNTLGRFSDVPMLQYVTEGHDGGLRVLEYTVIFSNEDGGTSSRNLMARWGRVTDIEYVYRVWIDSQGRKVKTLIQTRDHKDVPYQGAHFHDHPLLQPVTDNNMVEPAPPDASPLRFHLCPIPMDLSRGSRELVMDDEPWTYVIARKEMEREKKLRAPMSVDGEMIADPRNYLTVEMQIELKDAVVQAFAVMPGGKKMYGSASGRAAGYVDRNGWVRVSIELPPGQAEHGISALALECMTKTDPRSRQNPASGHCELKGFGKVFFASDSGAPGDHLKAPGGVTMRAGEIAVLPVQ